MSEHLLLDRLLARVRVCHTADDREFEPWLAGGCVVGRVHRSRLPRLAATASPLRFVHGAWQLDGDDFASRSAAMAALVADLARTGHCRPPLGELYPVSSPLAAAPLLQLDRAAVPWFGVAARGVHLNGFVRTGDGVLLWVARRARGKRTFPGHLDNLVAGGQAIGCSADATLLKECHEEAGIAAELARQARFATVLTYVQQDAESWKPDALACYDLELPSSFVPRPVDGEVEAFEAWPVERVLASLRGDDAWKPNCVLVVLDFLLRRGLVDGSLSGDARLRLWHALRGQRPAAS